MIEETGPGALDAAHRRRVRWEPSISLGNILTAVSMIGVGLVAFFDVRTHNAVQDARLTAIEAAASGDKARLQQEFREMRSDIRSDLQDLRRAVDEVAKRTNAGK